MAINSDASEYTRMYETCLTFDDLQRRANNLAKNPNVQNIRHSRHPDKPGSWQISFDYPASILRQKAREGLPKAVLAQKEAPINKPPGRPRKRLLGEAPGDEYKRPSLHKGGKSVSTKPKEQQ